MDNTAHGWNLHPLIEHCMFVGFVEEMTPIRSKHWKTASVSLITGGKTSSFSKGMRNNFMTIHFTLYRVFLHMLYFQCYNLKKSPFFKEMLATERHTVQAKVERPLCPMQHLLSLTQS
jgi:hypothetical protein